MTQPTPKSHWDGHQWVPFNWITFEAYYYKADGPCTYYGLGLPWVPLPDDYSVEEMESFKKKVFQYALELAEQARKPILSYPAK